MSYENAISPPKHQATSPAPVFIKYKVSSPRITGRSIRKCGLVWHIEKKLARLWVGLFLPT